MDNNALTWLQLDISPCSYQLLYRLIMVIFWLQHDITPCSCQSCCLCSTLFYSPQAVFILGYIYMGTGYTRAVLSCTHTQNSSFTHTSARANAHVYANIHEVHVHLVHWHNDMCIIQNVHAQSSWLPKLMKQYSMS